MAQHEIMKQLAWMENHLHGFSQLMLGEISMWREKMKQILVKA
jgi:hypothetical protein